MNQSYPVPLQPPTDGEVAELAALLREVASAWEPDARLLGNMTARQFARVADLLAQPKPEGPTATEHVRTQEINDLIAETVYGPRGAETSDCANAWEVSKLIASLQTRVKALEALDD